MKKMARACWMNALRTSEVSGTLLYSHRKKRRRQIEKAWNG
jgi:hypothetical protein